jgi:hypothetical protein
MSQTEFEPRGAEVLELPSSACGDGFGSLSSTSSRSACFVGLVASVPPRTRSSAGAVRPPRYDAEPSLRAAESVIFGENIRAQLIRSEVDYSRLQACVSALMATAH